MAVKKVISPVFRVSFPHVFVPQQFKDPKTGASGEPKFGVTAVFDPKYIAANPREQVRWNGMMALANEASLEFHKKALDKLPANFKKPVRDGEEKEELAGFGAGVKFCSMTSKMRPGIVAADGVTPITDESLFYPGCYARATVTAYGYDNVGKGVAFGLNNLMFVRDGERLDSRTDAAEDFSDLGEEQEPGEATGTDDAFS